MNAPDDPSERPSSRFEPSDKTCLIVGIVAGGLGSAFLLCGGGCLFLVFYYRSMPVTTDSDELERQLIVELAGNQVIEEHLGRIRSAELDMWASGEDDEAGAVSMWVFDVSGPKGSGILTVHGLDPDDPNSGVDWGTLQLDNGDVYDLFTGRLLAEPQPAESDEPRAQTTTETAADDGFAEFARKVRIDLEDHPVIREHVGEIEQITYDETGSLAEPDDIVFVFQLTGSKSSGTLRAACITVSNDEEDVTSGELTLENGETFQLFPDNPLDDTAEPNSASPAPHP